MNSFKRKVKFLIFSIMFFILFTYSCSLLTNFWFICDFEKYTYVFKSETGEEVRVLSDHVNDMIYILTESQDVFLLRSEVYIDNELKETYILNKKLAEVEKNYDEIYKITSYQIHKLPKIEKKPELSQGIIIKIILYYKLENKEKTSSTEMFYRKNPDYLCRIDSPYK